MIISIGMMAWVLLLCITGTDPPFVIIYNNSMGPGLKQGDLVLLKADRSPLQCGEIVVFKDLGQLQSPVIHRIIKVHKRMDREEVDLLTKGDDNPEDDHDGNAYGGSQEFIKQHQHVLGRASWYVPYAGWPIMVVVMYPFVKPSILLGVADIMLLTSKWKLINFWLKATASA